MEARLLLDGIPLFQLSGVPGHFAQIMKSRLAHQVLRLALTVGLPSLLSTIAIAQNGYRWITLAGDPSDFPGTANGKGSAARFNWPYGMAVDDAGNVFVADSSNHTIRKITPEGVVTTFAGTPGFPNPTTFYSPGGVAIDSSGNLFVANTGNHRIDKVTPAGAVSTFAGGGPGSPGNQNGTGIGAQFNHPTGIAIDSSDNLYVTDTGNGTIRKITPGGVVTTIAGSPGLFGSSDGTGSAARFNDPVGVAVDRSRNLYIADTGNSTIRKVTPGGVVTTLAGKAGQIGGTDGTGSNARFNRPEGLGIDASGNLFVADTDNHTIRKITPSGVVTSIGGVAGEGGHADGVGAAAHFLGPRGIAVAASGRVYVSEGSAHIIRAGLGSSGYTQRPRPSIQRPLPFPVTRVGRKSETQFLAITNRGSSPLRGMKLSTIGRNPKDFRCRQPRLRTLAPGAATTFSVIFRPKDRGIRKATVFIRSSGRPVKVPLIGRAVGG